MSDEQDFEDVGLDAHTNEAFRRLEDGTAEEDVDTTTPRHLEDHYRGLNPTAILGIAALLVVGLVGAFVYAFMHHGAAPSTTAGVTPITSAAPIQAANLLGLNPGTSGNYQGPSYADTDAVNGVTPAGANGPQSGFPFGKGGSGAPGASASPCPAGYMLVRVSATQPPVCVPSSNTAQANNGLCPQGYTVAPAQPGAQPGSPPTCVAIAGANGTNGTNGAQAPQPTPLPPQAFDIGGAPSPQPGNAQEAQAAASIARKNGAQPNVIAQPQPVFANGRFVGYVFPPGPAISANTVSMQNAGSNAPRSDVFASDGTPGGTAGGTGGTGTQGAGGTDSGTSGGTGNGSTGTQGEGQEPFGYAAPVSADQLDAMTVIPLCLITTVNSDQPGTFLAQVCADVYDSATHRHVVIPAGTMASGPYDARLTSNQTRLLGTISELRFANGREFYIGNQEVTDALGSSGMTGHVDNHGRQILNSALVLTVLGAANAALTPQTTSVLSAPTLGQQIQSVTAGQLAGIGNRLVGNQISRVPTITITPPYRFAALVMRDLPLDRYEVKPQISRLSPATPRPYYVPTPSAETAQDRRMPEPVVVPTPTATPPSNVFCCASPKPKGR